MIEGVDNEQHSPLLVVVGLDDASFAVVLSSAAFDLEPGPKDRSALASPTVKWDDDDEVVVIVVVVVDDDNENDNDDINHTLDVDGVGASHFCGELSLKL